jgi:hypothetical protein
MPSTPPGPRRWVDVVATVCSAFTAAPVNHAVLLLLHHHHPAPPPSPSVPSCSCSTFNTAAETKPSPRSRTMPSTWPSPPPLRTALSSWPSPPPRPTTAVWQTLSLSLSPSLYKFCFAVFGCFPR